MAGTLNRFFWFLSVAVLLAPGLSARQAPAPPAGTASVSGVVTIAGGREPVRKAQVRLASTSPRITRTATSDGNGRFVFRDLPAAEYTLSASKPGFLEMVLGAQAPGPARPGTPLRVAGNDSLENVALTLPRAGVVAGTVTDEFGDPAFNVPVRALRLVHNNGERLVQTAGNVVTDDLGNYRLAGLLPGEYLITAVPRDTVSATAAQAEALARQAQVQGAARGAAVPVNVAPPLSPKGYVAVYHPGTPAPSGAVVVRLGLSQQLFGIDVRLEIVETATISGVLRDARGAPIAGNLQLIDPAMPIPSVGVWFATSRADGRFSFPGVVAGEYLVRGHNSAPGSIGAGPNGTAFQMSAPVRVRAEPGPPAEISVAMQPNVTVEGLADFGAMSTAGDLSRVRVNLLPISTSADWELSAFGSVISQGGAFRVDEVLPGRYRVDVSGLPTGWSLASAVLGGVDTADHHLTIESGREYAGLQLRFSTASSELSGRVLTASGAPARANVVLFPADRQLWLPQSRRIRVTASGADGRYVFAGLPPGDYRAAAVAELEPGQQFDRGFLTGVLAGSTLVQITPGQGQNQDLRSLPPR